MISVDEATRIILDHGMDIPNTIVPLHDAIGHILREPLVADRDLPPYHRVTMDGIAIRYGDFADGRRQFTIAGVGAAGAPQAELKEPNQCLEIMTGAILPKQADTVIPYEEVSIDNGQATIKTQKVRAGQNIHRQGIDRQRGEVIVAPGRRLSAAEVGVAATIGKSQLKVAEFPPAVIISTGDELVEIHETPLPYQIRKSNVHRLGATLRRWGITADTAHLRDDKDKIERALSELLAKYRIVLISGGVSKGKFDYIPAALEALGVRQLFHRIRQRPGKPFWFGRSEQHDSLVFAFPGNPVSSFLCTLRYFRPWMMACLGLPALDQPQAVLAQDIQFTPNLTYFAQVRLTHNDDGTIQAYPIEGHGSGDLANLVDADAFVELPAGRTNFHAGEVYRVWPYR